MESSERGQKERKEEEKEVYVRGGKPRLYSSKDYMISSLSVYVCVCVEFRWQFLLRSLSGSPCGLGG